MGGKKNRNKGRDKIVRLSSEQPGPTKKIARWVQNPESSSRLPPVWVFAELDVDGPWGRILISAAHAWEDLLPKMRSFETMTWAEIETDRKRNHSVPVIAMCPKARKRAEEINLDVDELFRFRLNGKQRLWGIRDRERFKVLWWDPEHEVCPSVLKNT